MAKFEAHGDKLIATESPDGTRYTAMSDGIILRQYRIDGRLRPASISMRKYKGDPHRAHQAIINTASSNKGWTLQSYDTLSDH